MSAANIRHYYPPGPVAAAFLRSNAFIAGIRGPIGSGKSTAVVMKLLRHASMQPRQRNGRRRARYGVIRNTYDELRRTTVETWHQWVPKSLGRWHGGEQGPFSHTLNGVFAPDLDIEVEFLAMDQPDDVKKVLSWELTAAWVNEARELPKPVIDALTGRVGRFPAAADGGCFNPAVWLDTNPPDDDHWWYVLAERDPSTEADRRMLDHNAVIEAELRERGILAPGQPLVEFFSQPSGLSPIAENLANLRPGYYQFASVGKTEDWIKVYVRGEYGFVQEGKPVYPEYRDSVHCAAFELIPGLPIRIGLDFGLTPAAVFAQRSYLGQWRWHTELCTQDTGIYRFAELLHAHVAEHYRGYKFVQITGDPAGDQRSPTDAKERTTFQILRALKVPASPASSNDFTRRREAVARPLSRLIDGAPGLVIHPNCRTTRKGMAGGYAYKRLRVTGEERFENKPHKNMYSHSCEAGQYLHLGGGEWQEIKKGAGMGAAPAIVMPSFQPADPGMGY
ncbi:MAG: hypothetical protein AB7Q97_01750 [Gammaproteobacteria bacterium]